MCYITEQAADRTQTKTKLVILLSPVRLGAICLSIERKMVFGGEEETMFKKISMILYFCC